MAIRNMLHMSQLKAFEEFLESKGYLIIPTVGAYEVLRARKPKENMVIVYRKGGAKEHLSIMDKDFYLVNEFLRTREAVVSKWKRKLRIVHLRSLQGGLTLEPVMVDGVCWML